MILIPILIDTHKFIVPKTFIEFRVSRFTFVDIFACLRVFIPLITVLAFTMVSLFIASLIKDVHSYYLLHTVTSNDTIYVHQMK